MEFRDAGAFPADSALSKLGDLNARPKRRGLKLFASELGHRPGWGTAPLLVRGVSRAACCEARRFPCDAVGTSRYGTTDDAGQLRAQVVTAPLFLYFTRSNSKPRSGRARRRAPLPLTEVTDMKQALRLLTKVLTHPRLGPDQGERLQRAKRELEAVARSGKLDRERVFRAVRNIAEVLLGIV
jgi:hypothetical protein